MLYTIVQNCKNHGVAPEIHLTDVLERLPLMKNDPEAMSELTPKNWNKQHQHTARG